MDRYGYTLKKAGEKEVRKRYHEADLLGMTTYQLKEICREERIIQGVINPLDKEELIRVILKYRGAGEYFLINGFREGGMQAVEDALRKSRLDEKACPGLGCGPRVILWEGTAARFYDNMTVPYEKELAGTNALVVSGDGTVCTILNMEAWGERTDVLYLTKEAAVPCRETGTKNFSLYCMDGRISEAVYGVYYGLRQKLPEHMKVYRIPLPDFEVRRPAALSLPLAIDFGSSSTTAGAYLDSLYFQASGLRDGEIGLKQNGINHAVFYDASPGREESPLLPSVAGVLSAEPEHVSFSFGYDAVRMGETGSQGEDASIFYDIKRWITDYEKEEEITDRKGRRGFVKRKDILEAYFSHVLGEAGNRFKCEVKRVHISCPVKQKACFQRLFSEILSSYTVELEDMVDEGVSVLYGTIRDMINQNRMAYGEEYRALVIDCGGGTTDLCSCRFRVWDQRVSYRIRIETAYENGDTDFGGNNLTYRIMQFLKVLTVNRLRGDGRFVAGEILGNFEGDIYRTVDEEGTAGIYRNLTEMYQAAEEFLPTRFREYRDNGREGYGKARGNFFFLFQTAERVKKVFYESTGAVRIIISSLPVDEDAAIWIPVGKWKMSVYNAGHLETWKEFPPVSLTVRELELLLKADIYGIIQRFLGEMYKSGETDGYSIIKLTGQSCKIGLFRDALKEFVPGKVIRFTGKGGKQAAGYGLKMACVDGVLEYFRDKKYGYADTVIHTGVPALPYDITAFTHSGEEIILVHGSGREATYGMVSRNMEDLSLRLYLKDPDGRVRHEFVCQSPLGGFRETTYEELAAGHGGKIRQADTDDIVEREVRFFVWAEALEWEFHVLPVCRRDGKLAVGREERFPFEKDAWMRDYFDGTW